MGRARPVARKATIRGNTGMGFFAIRPRPMSETEIQPVDAERFRLMCEIMELNQTARREFLESFDRCKLARYLDHLVSARGPRGAGSIWPRPGETPAILARVET